MKKLLLKSPSFIYLEQSFKEWLDVLGYAPSTIYQLPVMLREFFHYLEQKGFSQISQIDTPIIVTYYKQLSQRTNQRTPARSGTGGGRGLSNNYLNGHLLALDKLFEYLRQNTDYVLPIIPIPKESPDPKPVIPLTTDQIKSLYEATQNYKAKNSMYALRDRAILAIYYDCGLRRTEGVKLNTSDIQLDSRILHVKHGKGKQQRFVPFSKSTAITLTDYLYEARPKFANHTSKDAFFLNKKGKRANGLALSRRLKYIQQHTDDTELRHLHIHLHLLRHSIATHLLYSGMSLEKVAQFLGHYSLSSTQIYTHLVSEAEDWRTTTNTRK